VITSSATRVTRTVRVAEIMGTTVSLHVVHEVAVGSMVQSEIQRRADAVFDDLRAVDRLFSTYRPDSEIMRIARGELLLADADDRVHEVSRACARAEEVSGGLFSAHRAGWFDPTGYVKGWAVEAAADTWLGALLNEPGVIAVGLNAGGDMQLATHPDADWIWRVGVADPARPGSLVATLEVRDGAVATSGSAERGDHIIDPRTGDPARGVASATVVAAGLADADVRATVAVIAGFDAFAVNACAGTRGLIVGHDGRVRRWMDTTEVSVVSPSTPPFTVR
jgi:thiamine biosynthesis lipoprotein